MEGEDRVPPGCYSGGEEELQRENLSTQAKFNPLGRAEFDWCWPSTVYSVLAQKSQPDFTNQCPFVSDILGMTMARRQLVLETPVTGVGVAVEITVSTGKWAKE